MLISCGAFIFDKDDRLLIVKNTNGIYWNLPKGKLEKDESLVEAAFREVYEETGIDLTKDAINYNIIGTFSYLPHKDLFLIRVDLDEHFSTELVCESTFLDKNGRYVPEIEAYDWIDIKDYADYFSGNLIKVIKNIFINREINSNF